MPHTGTETSETDSGSPDPRIAIHPHTGTETVPSHAPEGRRITIHPHTGTETVQRKESTDRPLITISLTGRMLCGFPYVFDMANITILPTRGRKPRPCKVKRLRTYCKSPPHGDGNNRVISSRSVDSSIAIHPPHGDGNVITPIVVPTLTKLQFTPTRGRILHLFRKVCLYHSIAILPYGDGNPSGSISAKSHTDNNSLPTRGRIIIDQSGKVCVESRLHFNPIRGRKLGKHSFKFEPVADCNSPPHGDGNSRKNSANSGAYVLQLSLTGTVIVGSLQKLQASYLSISPNGDGNSAKSVGIPSVLHCNSLPTRGRIRFRKIESLRPFDILPFIPQWGRKLRKITCILLRVVLLLTPHGDGNIFCTTQGIHWSDYTSPPHEDGNNRVKLSRSVDSSITIHPSRGRIYVVAYSSSNSHSIFSYPLRGRKQLAVRNNMRRNDCNSSPLTGTDTVPTT